ncbi:MAG: tetratricopeptide repeat protein [Nitrospirales bacterium]
MTPETSLPDPLLARIKQAMHRASEGMPLEAETAQAEYHTAMDLCQAVGTDETRLTDLDEQHDLFLLDWAIELPFQLARAGLVDEAATLAMRFAAITEADNFLPDRAIILAEAGRREEALAQVIDNLTRFAEDPWVVIKSGDVHDTLGEHDQAEQLYRRGLELAGDDTYTRAGAVERLIPLLDKTGRNAEADALVDAETARDIEWKERVSDELDRKLGYSPPLAPADTTFDPFAEPDDFDAFPMPYTRPDPKIGRNDPCPCGSGKKYKKCCLGKT